MSIKNTLIFKQEKCGIVFVVFSRDGNKDLNYY